MDKPVLYYVCSKSLITGHESRGTQAFPRKLAQDFAKDLSKNSEYKNMVFWIEKKEDIDKNANSIST